MTNYKALFADILGLSRPNPIDTELLDMSQHAITKPDFTRPDFTRHNRMATELARNWRSIVYDNDQGLLVVYDTAQRRLELWQATSVENDLFSCQDATPMMNDSLTFLQNKAEQWAKEWQEYEDTLGNNGEPIANYAEDDWREER